MRLRQLLFCLFIGLCSVSPYSQARAAYNLEVPADPWDEFRLQFKVYSKHLLASYDRAFADDYQGAIREVNKAIELIPDEGIGFAERGKYHRILNESAKADSDLKKALTLFETAIERYRNPGKHKSFKNSARSFDPAEAARLIATLRYQRGEAYFGFEMYHQASDDFAAACQGGNNIACSRIWDIKAAEKRGLRWAPISSRQYYDRQRVERPSRDLVRAWVRREEFQPVRAETGGENYVQQHLEMKCDTREFRLIEAFVFSGGSQTVTEKIEEAGFTKVPPSTALSRLFITLCSNPPVK